MREVFSLTQGQSPLLISIPHDGRLLMPGQAERMTEEAKSLPDNDWFVRELYEFATELGANVIAANYSRYVIDLNRPADDTAMYAGQVSTGLCPHQTFAGEDIYIDGASVAPADMETRVLDYWQPYHDKLAGALSGIKKKHGFALLWDAHSIASQVPRLFPGRLTDLNLGTNAGASCAPDIEAAVFQSATTSNYSAVVNGRFKGGYITRRYGDPDRGVHAIQLELSQACYMNEKELRYDADLAHTARSTLMTMLGAFLVAAGTGQ